MSVQEIKRSIERLSAEERTELESFLRARRVATAADFAERVAAAHGRIDAGDAVSAQDLRTLLAEQSGASAS